MPLLTCVHPVFFSSIDSMPKNLANLQGSEMKAEHNKDAKKDFRVSIDLPGVKVNDLQIKVEEGFLHISGFRRIVSKEKNDAKRNRFSYTVTVDDDTDLSKICANLADGVLVITAPKIPRPEPIAIPITTEPHESFAKRTFERKSIDLKDKSEAQGEHENLVAAGDKTNSISTEETERA